MYAFVSIWLFASGVLALVGYWSITRKLGASTAQLATLAERAKQTDTALVVLAVSIDRLQASIHQQRQEITALRVQLADFIEGPPSMRRPSVAVGAHATETSS